MKLNGVEFYTTPDGDVMYKQPGEPVKMLEQCDRDVITGVLSHIQDLWPIAFERLAKTYSVNELNRVFYEFNMVTRFLACNCGEYDGTYPDIDADGKWNLELVRCPLRGRCKDEGVICKPELRTSLTERETEILELISRGKQATEIAYMLNISPFTVNRHRENIKVRLKLRTIGEMVSYYHQNMKK